MIYNRFGDELEIVERNGMHQIEAVYQNKPLDVHLVRVKYKDDGEMRYALAETLKADNGWTEIEAAMNAVDLHALSKTNLKSAMRQAL